MRRIVSLWVPEFHEDRLPVLVVSQAGPAGRVIGASPKAAAAGVRDGMTARVARRICPDAAVRVDDPGHYSPVSEHLGTILCRFTPWVEQVAEDEFFADLGAGGAEDGLEMARRIQEAVSGELRLRACIGLAGGKLAARVACRTDSAIRLADLAFVPARRRRSSLPSLFGRRCRGGRPSREARHAATAPARYASVRGTRLADSRGNKNSCRSGVNTSGRAARDLPGRRGQLPRLDPVNARYGTGRGFFRVAGRPGTGRSSATRSCPRHLRARRSGSLLS